MIFLDAVQSEFGTVVIGIDRATGAQIYYHRGWCQSEADEHGISYAPYIHAMFGVIQQTPAVDVLMIGCGGGTLATMLSRTGRRVTVVDINPAAIDLARSYFAMDGTVASFVADGMAWLASATEAFDCIVVDAFDGAEVPDHLCSAAFFALVRRQLRPQGVVLMNVFEDKGGYHRADSIAAHLRDAGLTVKLLEEGIATDQNVIVIGGPIQDLRKPGLLVSPEGAADQLARDLDRMRFRD